jgi:uncharacterized protein YqiB (DUF1249 family)
MIQTYGESFRGTALFSMGDLQVEAEETCNINVENIKKQIIISRKYTVYYEVIQKAQVLSYHTSPA